LFSNTGAKSPQDVLAGVLSFVEADHLDANTEKIHETFASLKGQFPDILDNFIFSNNDIFPYSRELDEAMGYLSVARIIGHENPDYQLMIIKKDARPYLKRLVNRVFNQEEKESLKKIASVLADSLKVN